MRAVLNDVHSGLNPTSVAEVVRPADVDGVRAAVARAAGTGRSVSIAGGRHAMGGQQFEEGSLHLDMTGLARLLRFDGERGLAEFEAGAQWRGIIAALHATQEPGPIRWTIRQKQTGADDLTLGGAISANAHGRGLLMGPIVDDIEDVTVVTADGSVVRCGRAPGENRELFALVVGGYGLFGVIVSATLRLGPRLKMTRVVDVIELDDAMNAAVRRIADGCLYGDFQYAIEPADDGFLRRGVMACYKPAGDDVAVSDDRADLSRDDWLKLLALAHADKPRAFREYARHYVGTHGRVYWSDTMQLSTYIPSYAEFLHGRISPSGADHVGEPRTAPPRHPGPAGGANTESLVIGEHYVKPCQLMAFMEMARRILRESGVEDIYGTIRLIRRDTTTFLPWATDDFVCVIFNLRTEHTPAGIARTHEAFRRLTDASLSLGGGFYLTYHRAATREQVEAAYPRFNEFLRLKREHDPAGVFRSAWYRHYPGMPRNSAARPSMLGVTAGVCGDAPPRPRAE